MKGPSRGMPRYWACFSVSLVSFTFSFCRWASATASSNWGETQEDVESVPCSGTSYLHPAAMEARAVVLGYLLARQALHILPHPSFSQTQRVCCFLLPSFLKREPCHILPPSNLVGPSITSPFPPSTSPSSQPKCLSGILARDKTFP